MALSDLSRVEFQLIPQFRRRAPANCVRIRKERDFPKCKIISSWDSFLPSHRIQKSHMVHDVLTSRLATVHKSASESMPDVLAPRGALRPSHHVLLTADLLK